MKTPACKTAMAYALAMALGAGVSTASADSMGKKFGAPVEGMSAEEYRSLVFLDPQNTVRMDWDAVKGMDGYFLIDNQGDPTVSVVDYNKGETVKKAVVTAFGAQRERSIPGAGGRRSPFVAVVCHSDSSRTECATSLTETAPANRYRHAPPPTSS